MRRGFEDPVLDAQRCFRTILMAMSGPGTIHALDDAIETPAELSLSSAQTLLTLADAEAPVWLAPQFSGAADYVRFHCNAPIVDDPAMAMFAVIDARDGQTQISRFAAGDERYPDRSATLIVQCASLEGGYRPLFSGPGIEPSAGARATCLAPLHLGEAFWAEASLNNERYPLGVDFIFSAGASISCVPRSTRIALPVRESN